MDYMFEWERILVNKLPLVFLLEIVLRSAVMFILLLITLKLTGKRGVKQLSIFEMVIIISLGSAAGDPMFYEDVGIVHAVIVFLIIIILYRFVTWLAGKNPRFEKLLEGKTECLVVDGRFSKNKFEEESISQDEFFAELRLKSVEHLGQVKNAYIETSGDISIFFYEDEDVKPGLPVRPELFSKKSKTIAAEGLYACSICGEVNHYHKGMAICPVCQNDEWVPALKTRRIA